MDLPQLSRACPRRNAPVRIVHLGLGAFHRSHQAWYTHQAGDAADWGIAAFTGRRPDAAAGPGRTGRALHARGAGRRR